MRNFAFLCALCVNQSADHSTSLHEPLGAYLMQVVILAAGQGSRLAQGDLPKPLTPLIDGKSILQHQIDILSKYVSLNDILVVVGYHKELIIESFPKLHYIHNPDFATQNTSKSLLLALRSCHEDVLWLNGDVVFHPSVIATVLKNPRTSMVVNTAQVDPESVKYQQNPHGRILKVSKHVRNPQGEALGINFCQKNDLVLFRKKLAICDPMDYFEKGLELCIKDGMPLWSVCIDANLCTEIDFPEDLDRANALLKEWKV